MPDCSVVKAALDHFHVGLDANLTNHGFTQYDVQSKIVESFTDAIDLSVIDVPRTLMCIKTQLVVRVSAPFNDSNR